MGIGFSARLTWRDNSTDELEFIVERALHGGEWNVRQRLPADTTTFDDSNLSTSSHYWYRVRASNAAGASQHSNLADVTTPESAGGGGRNCGVIIDMNLGGSGLAAAAADEIWMFQNTAGREELVAWAAVPGDSREIVLDGGAAGTTWLDLQQRGEPGILRLAMNLRFSAMRPSDDGRLAGFCLVLHDRGEGRYVSAGRPSTARREHAGKPAGGQPVTVRPGSLYPVEVTIDLAARRYEVRLFGMLLASDVDVRDVLVVPVRYAHPDLAGR